MTMAAAGLAKLIEECNELGTVLAKKLQYWHTDWHPDGKGSLAQRMEEEIADVLAAAENVIRTPFFNLSRPTIEERVRVKLALFGTWQAQLDNNDFGIDGRR